MIFLSKILLEIKKINRLKIYSYTKYNKFDQDSEWRYYFRNSDGTIVMCAITNNEKNIYFRNYGIMDNIYNYLDGLGIPYEKSGVYAYINLKFCEMMGPDLKNPVDEIKKVNSPKDGPSIYIKTHLNQFINKINEIQGKNFVTNYLGNDFKTSRSDANYEEYGYGGILLFKADDDPNLPCETIFITDYIGHQFEGDGPLNQGVIFELNGYKFQYQVAGC